MDNYTPASILLVLSKILEKAVNFQLQQYLKKFDLPSPAQSGFRQHHSTESVVTYLTKDQKKSRCWKVNWCLICRSQEGLQYCAS